MSSTDITDISERHALIIMERKFKFDR